LVIRLIKNSKNSKECTLQEGGFDLSPLRLREAVMAEQGRAFQEIKQLEGWGFSNSLFFSHY
jgi:hypothetical protein